MTAVQTRRVPGASDQRILRLLSLGHSYPEIAQKLGRTTCAITQRIYRLRTTYDVFNNAALIYLATKEGWIS